MKCAPGLVVFEQSLWEALPQYLRAVDRALAEATGTPLPLDVAPGPIRIVDWRRSRRQSEHYARGDAPGDLARALAGRPPLYEGHRRAAQRAVAVGVARERRVARASGRGARAVSRPARGGARPPRGDARSGRRGARGVHAEADGHCAVPGGGRARGAARALLPVARVDRQRDNRRRAPDGHPATRDHVRRDAGAAGSSAGGAAPHGGHRLDCPGGGHGPVCRVVRARSSASAGAAPGGR